MGAGPCRLILDFDRITTEEAAPLVENREEWRSLALEWRT
jgi:hypothetical protein